MADIEEVKQKINLLDYIRRTGFDLGKESKSNGGYLFKNCPICQSTSERKGDNGHFFVNPTTNSYSSFSGCCRGGSIIDYLMEAEHLDKKEAINKAYEIAGLSSNATKETNKKEEPIQKSEGKRVSKEMEENRKETARRNQAIMEQKKQFIIAGIKNQTEANKEQVYNYLATRGISKEIADRFHLFISNNVYEDEEKVPRIVIPVYKDNEPISYVARAITKEVQRKVLNSAGEQTPLNIDYLKETPKDDKKIYICEGWADALSFEDIEKKAIALHSTQQTNKLFEAIKQHKETASQYTYILCCDNDEAGEKANNEMTKYFEENNLKSYILEIPKKYNDINDWYKTVNNKEEFKIQTDPFSIQTVSSYIDNSFLNDIKKMKEYKYKSTGFQNLDNVINGIYPGLYVLGAISSLGKTTFIHQVADQMASKGEHIIFFSLEQSKFELVAKSISRQTFIIDNRNAKTNINIMQETNIEDITKEAVRKYQDISKNITIVEGNFDVTVETIRNYIEKYIVFTGIKPIIVLDYLQILRPIKDRLTDKQQVDYNITELKRISRDFNIPVFVICSFNRENYTTTVDFASFKESGAIEYSADVVMGLQLQVMEEIQEIKNPKVSDIREKINQAKDETPRKVQLIGLKNRNGKSYFKCNFNYYSMFNYFEDIDSMFINNYRNNRPGKTKSNTEYDELELPF